MNANMAASNDEARRRPRSRWLRLHSALIGLVTMSAGFVAKKLLAAGGVFALARSFEFETADPDAQTLLEALSIMSKTP